MKRFLLFLLLTRAAAAADFNEPKSLVDTALANHPTLVRLRAEVEAARERVDAAGALPNPMLMTGVRDKQIDLRDDEMMTMYMVGASQTLVRGDRRTAQRNLARLEAGIIEKQLDSVRAEIERDVLLAWYEVAVADAQIRAAMQVRELIDAVVAAARVRYEVGTAEQADVIRAQLEQSDLDHELLRLRGARRTAVARLIPLLGLPLTTEVPAIILPENTEDLAIDATAIPPSEHPALAASALEVVRAEETIELMRLAAKPDIDLEASYGMRPQQRDMFSVTARIELPLRRDRTVEPRVREAIAARDAARARTDEIRRALTQELSAAVAIHLEATEQLAFHRDVLVPQARLAFDSTLAAYQTGKAPFDAILNTETAYLRLQLQYFDFLARHAQAVVNYEALRRGARGSAMSPAAALNPTSGATRSAGPSM